VQNTWDRLLPQQAGVPYRHAKLVLFRDYTDSGCGTAQSATGPFYCPVDEKVYIDLAFFDELRSRFGAPGEFRSGLCHRARAWASRAENPRIEQQVSSLRRRDPSLANPLSVKLELQADCLSGVWATARSSARFVDSSDVAAGIQAAASVGTTVLQRMATGHVSPETFTHGSSAQRTAAFQGGMEAGQIGACEIKPR